MYELLQDEHRRQMLERAILNLEVERFEAEINVTIGGDDVMMSEHETAGQRVQRIDRQLVTLREAYKDLLKDLS